MIIDFMLTPVWDAIQDISGSTFDPSLYTPTSGFSTINGSAITEGGNLVIEGGPGDLSDYWTSAETKNYVDTELGELSGVVQEQQIVFSSGYNELHTQVMELSGRTVDLSGYYTSGETDAAISAATAGKADAVNVQANTNQKRFPRWNEQGIITGTQEITSNVSTRINGTQFNPLVTGSNYTIPPFFAPQSAGTAGDILVSTGNGAPVWSAMPAGDVTKAYVDSADTALQDQIDTIDAIVPAALVDLNTRKVESTSVHTIWKGTQADYDLIITKDPATFYIIVNN